MSPSRFRGAPEVTEYLYDEQGWIARTVTASQWGEGDRALMLARDSYRRSLCPGCKQPTDRAWHPSMEGWYEVAVFTCNACTARAKAKPGDHQRVALHDAYPDAENGPLGPRPPVTFRDPEDTDSAPMAAPPSNQLGGE